jgi:hypothetical protein
LIVTIRILSSLALLATVAACAPTKFDGPPGMTEAQFHRDNLECTMIGKKMAGDQFTIGPPLFVAAAAIGRDNEIRATHDECMLAKAYTIHRD